MRVIPVARVSKPVQPKTLARDVAKAFSGKALRRIVETLDLRSTKQIEDGSLVDLGPAPDAIASARWLLEWTEGKAAQAVAVTGQIDHVHLHLDALRQLADEPSERIHIIEHNQ